METESRAVRLALVLLVTIQHSAFIYVPTLLSGRGFDDLAGTDDPINGISVALSALIVGWLTASRFRTVTTALLRNPLLLAYIALIFLSTVWSIHPDLTFKRAIGYVVSTGVAVVLATRYDFMGSMKVISSSFTLAAVGSLLFVLALPQYGIMITTNELSGTWRGVYTHKEVLGASMAFAVVVQGAVVLGRGGVSWGDAWRALLFLFLVMMTKSALALVISMLVIAVVGVFLCFKWSRLLGILAGVSASTAGLFVAALALIDRAALLGLLGKDEGLTGRVELWDAIFRLIGQRPVLGWGYRATWVPTDQDVAYVNYLTGDWGVAAAPNSYLEMALELGVIGLVLLVVIMLHAAYLGVAAWRRGRTAEGITMLMVVAILVVAGQVYEMVGLNQNPAWLIFLVLVYCLNGRYSLDFVRGEAPAGAKLTSSGLRQSARLGFN